MLEVIISVEDVLAKVIHANYRVLVVLDRLDIKLGLGSKTIAEVAVENDIQPDAFLLILNLFCNKEYIPAVEGKFEYIPTILTYLKNSHTYFLEEKIPTIQKDIQQLVTILNDSKATTVELFYNNYIKEVNEHMEYEDTTVFPYIEQLYSAYLEQEASSLPTDFTIKIYGEHHDDIEDVLKDLKNILIRHLPQKEEGTLRRIVLQQLFELESDLFSHTRLENEVLISLVKDLENKLK